jgi:hypothetical protein
MFSLSPRAKIIRDAVFFTPLFLLTLVTLLLMLVGATDQGLIGLLVLSVLTFLFGYQSIQSLRDLRLRPRTVEGTVTKRWRKREMMVTRSNYVTIDRMIYRIPAEAYLDVQVGDRVRIVAYPHTATVVSVERLGRAEGESAAPAADGSALGARGRARTLRTARATPRGRATAGEQPTRAEKEPAEVDEPAP